MSSYLDFLPPLRFQPSVAFSPDGSRVAYLDDASGQFNVAVHRLTDPTPSRLTSYSESTVRKLAWHPDGSSLVYFADTQGDEKMRIYQTVVGGGEARQLLETPGVQYAAALEYPFSPDGRYLLYAANDRSPGDQDVLVRDMASAEVCRVYAGGGRVFPGTWSPEGDRLSVVHLRESNSDHVLYAVTREGGQPRRLTPLEGAATYWPGPWLAGGHQMLVRSNAGREFTGLAAIDATTGAMTWLDTPPWDVERAALSGDRRVLVWTINMDGASQLRARELYQGARLSVPELPAGTVQALTVSPDGRHVAMLFSSPTQPPNVVIGDLATGRLRWLTDAHPPATSQVKLVEPTVVRYPTRDGREVPANLYRPTDSAEPLGVVLALHGGPELQERPEYSNDGFYQFLASNGVAVLAPNPRGSTGYGISYQRMVHRDWGGGDVRDCVDGAIFLRQQPWVDPARIGLVGRSYGGFLVLSCVARFPELGWAAAVDWCGPSNLLTFARAQPPSWRSRVATMIGDPDTDAEFLTTRSPVTHAGKIRAPLLIIQGANDPRVPRQESDQIVAKLRARGVEVRYDIYPDEGHVFGKRANQIRARIAAGEFLLAHLRR